MPILFMRYSIHILNRIISFVKKKYTLWLIKWYKKVKNLNYKKRKGNL